MEKIAETIDLRTFRVEPLPAGTGGGSHLLFGGVSIEENPFFARPGWLASILRYWQHHPALSYLFTGCYVGVSSQAPRPDESGNTLLDLELAYRREPLYEDVLKMVVPYDTLEGSVYGEGDATFNGQRLSGNARWVNHARRRSES